MIRLTGGKTKRCAKCLKTKQLGDFYRKPNGKPGHLARCKDCVKTANGVAGKDWYRRNGDAVRAQRAVYRKTEHYRQLPCRSPEASLAYRVRSQYGLTLDEYRAILARGCAICGTDQQLVVDHDHSSGKVRDALCRGCNLGLGHFQEDPERMRAAADFIQDQQ